MAWLLLLVGLGYFALSATALFLRGSASVADFIGGAVLTASGLFGLTHARDAGWQFTLMFAGLVVGIAFFGWSLRRWSTPRTH